jgi:hypothetical protein
MEVDGNPNAGTVTQGSDNNNKNKNKSKKKKACGNKRRSHNCSYGGGWGQRPTR